MEIMPPITKPRDLTKIDWANEPVPEFHLDVNRAIIVSEDEQVFIEKFDPDHMKETQQRWVIEFFGQRVGFQPDISMKLTEDNKDPNDPRYRCFYLDKIGM